MSHPSKAVCLSYQPCECEEYRGPVWGDFPERGEGRAQREEVSSVEGPGKFWFLLGIVSGLLAASSCNDPGFCHYYNGTEEDSKSLQAVAFSKKICGGGLTDWEIK